MADFRSHLPRTSEGISPDQEESPGERGKATERTSEGASLALVNTRCSIKLSTRMVDLLAVVMTTIATIPRAERVIQSDVARDSCVVWSYVFMEI